MDLDYSNSNMSVERPMTITLHKWTSADKEALMALCNAVDRTFLSDRLPHRIIGQVFPENVASVRVLEKNGFRLEETIVEKVIKSGMVRDVKLYRKGNFF